MVFSDTYVVVKLSKLAEVNLTRLADRPATAAAALDYQPSGRREVEVELSRFAQANLADIAARPATVTGVDLASLEGGRALSPLGAPRRARADFGAVQKYVKAKKPKGRVAELQATKRTREAAAERAAALALHEADEAAAALEKEAKRARARAEREIMRLEEVESALPGEPLHVGPVSTVGPLPGESLFADGGGDLLDEWEAVTGGPSPQPRRPGTTSPDPSTVDAAAGGGEKGGESDPLAGASKDWLDGARAALATPATQWGFGALPIELHRSSPPRAGTATPAAAAARPARSPASGWGFSAIAGAARDTSPPLGVRPGTSPPARTKSPPPPVTPAGLARRGPSPGEWSSPVSPPTGPDGESLLPVATDHRAELTRLRAEYQAARPALDEAERAVFEEELTELGNQGELAALHAELDAASGGLGPEERAVLEAELAELGELADLKPGTP